MATDQTRFKNGLISACSDIKTLV